MDVALHVVYSMVHNLMKVFAVQAHIRFQGVGEDFGTGFDVLPTMGLKGFLAAVALSIT